MSTALEVARSAAFRVSESGDEASFPEADVAALERGGVLRAPFPAEWAAKVYSAAVGRGQPFSHTSRARQGKSFTWAALRRACERRSARHAVRHDRTARRVGWLARGRRPSGGLEHG